MKNFNKIMSVVLGAVLTVSVSGCASSGTKASSKALSAGNRALELADEYLDSKVRYNEISAELDYLHESLDYADPTKDDSPETRADFYIALDIFDVDTKIMLDSMDGTRESYDNVLKARNNLAEGIGAKTRK